MKRVVITGVGVVTPLGETLDEVSQALHQNRSAVRIMEGWDSEHFGLRTRLGAPALSFLDNQLDRKTRRTMSRVAMMAVTSTGRALEDCGWTEDQVQSHRTAIAYGSSMGGTKTIEEAFGVIGEKKQLTQGINSTTFLKVMPHTCASNIAIHYRIPGRIITTCVACASSTQALGYGFEAIRAGLCERALAGGAEELTPTVCAIFDVLGATSTVGNNNPELSPLPFDARRDGIVVGEGAVTFALEEREAALQRGAKIYAEVVGFYTNNDAEHMTNPSVAGLVKCMLGALEDAHCPPDQVDFVNAHAAGTSAGDLAESLAISQIFGDRTPVCSLKGHFGHLMGAAGGAEIAGGLVMLRENCVFPTRNLLIPDPEGGPLLHVMGETRCQNNQVFLKNSFAFGGVNASIVVKKA